MKWLNEFQQARQAGKNAFLLTGAVNDVFPNDRIVNSRSPLSTLPETLMEHVGCQSNTLIWSFDPSDGFAFPDKDTRERFLKIFSEDEQNPPSDGDDLVNSARTAPSEIQLPQRPSEAMQLIEMALNQTSGEESGPKCTVIFPDIDTYLAAGPGTNGSDQQMTLKLYRLCASERYRRAGHTIVLTAAASSQLPARFNGQDSPCCLISIWRPDLEERQAFIGQITCSDERATELQAELRRLTDERSAWREKLGKKAADELNALEAKISAHEAETAKLIEQETAQSRRKLAEAELLRKEMLDQPEAEKWQTELERLRPEIERLEKFLEDNTDLPCTADAWRSMSVGDYICLGRASRISLILTEPDSEGFVSHSHPDDLSAPTRTRDGQGIILLGLGESGSGQIVAKHSVSGVTKTCGPAKHFSIIPARVHEARQNVATHRERAETLEGLIQRHLTKADKLTRVAAEKLEKTEQNVRDRQRGKLDKLNSQRLGLKSKLRIGHADEPFKHDTRIAELQAKLPEMPLNIAAEQRHTLTMLMNGFSYRDIRNFIEACSRSTLKPESLLRQERLGILRRSYGEYLEISEPTFGFKYLAGKQEPAARLIYDVAKSIESGEYWRIPRGTLLSGPPGTGKTFLGEVLAAECGWLVAKPKEVRRSWLGESEQRAEMQTQAVRNIQYIVVIRDEVDRTDTQRDAPQGDSGTSGRINACWMDLMNDPALQGKVFFLSMTNRPDKIDLAQKRAGRTDESIPVLPPGRTTRRELFPVLVRQLNKQFSALGGDTPTLACDLSDEELDKLADVTKWYTPAEIRLVIHHAATKLARREGDQVRITADGLLERIAMTLPRSRREMAQWSLLAIRECTQRDYLPENYEEVIRELRQIAEGGDSGARPPNGAADSGGGTIVLAVPVGGKNSQNMN